MNAAPTRFGGQVSWVTGMAILGLGMPLVAIWLRRGSTGMMAQAAGAADYRAMVAALVIGVAGSVVALLGSRSLTRAWQRWSVVGAASLGMLLSAYLLWLTIGLCGLQVLWGMCRP